MVLPTKKLLIICDIIVAAAIARARASVYIAAEPGANTVPLLLPQANAGGVQHNKKEDGTANGAVHVHVHHPCVYVRAWVERRRGGGIIGF